MEPMEDAWRFTLEDMRLELAGAPCRLVGVPVDAGGVRALVEGAELAVEIQPDEETGRLSFGLAAAFAIPAEGGVFSLNIADLPSVELVIGPKEEHKEEEGAANARAGESDESPIPPAEEGPTPTPQRPTAD